MINNFLGIDISKDRFDVFLSFISKKGKRETRKRSFKNDDHGFQSLLSFLQKHNVEEVKACMESTGCYGETLAEFLHNAGHFVSVVNPYCIKCYARSKLIRQKNDQIDTEIIADYCQKQEPSRWTPPSLVSSFLHERGLILSEEKTKITSITTGFDFLGCNVRRYNKKLIIKPSKESIKRLLNKAHTLIKANIANTQAIVIKSLNSLLRGWGNYYHHVCAKKAFRKIDNEIWHSLWKWAKKRHPRKGLRWIKNRYFKVMGQRQWVFAAPICKNKPKEIRYLRLLKLIDIPIRRHVKIRADANPLDLKWKKYFDERVAKTKMLTSSFSREGSLLLVSPLKVLFSEESWKTSRFKKRRT